MEKFINQNSFIGFTLVKIARLVYWTIVFGILFDAFLFGVQIKTGSEHIKINKYNIGSLTYKLLLQ